ncbi:MAG: DNA translocase FtsK [Epulopiscium sp.]|nr:DNA translocase FtsK [Candidatus Epulonipiscium sp.]
MGKKIAKRKKTKNFKVQRSSLSQEIKGIIIFAIALILGVGIYTKQGGIFGKWINNFSLGLLGIGAYLLPVVFSIVAIIILLKKQEKITKCKLFSAITMILLLSTFIHILYLKPDSAISPADMNLWSLISYYYYIGDWNNGGLLGAFLANILLSLVGIYGSYIVIFSLLIVLFIILTGNSFVEKFGLIINWLKNNLFKKILSLKRKKKKEKTDSKPKIKEIELSEKINEDIMVLDFAEKNEDSELVEETLTKQEKEFIEDNKKDNIKEENSFDDIIPTTKEYVDYQFPPIDLLQSNPYSVTSHSKNKMLDNAKKLEKTLYSFGVEAKVIQINRGPTVTRYELQPKQGVKVSKIVSLSDDIALNLAASGIRIEAPIPGKAAVGIEVPNEKAQAVYLREVIEDEEFKKFPSKLAFALGKDIAGNSVIADIARMPHLLIAGATGSGKSVCINTLIASILYKAKPDEVKLIMIDPKVVELSIYNGIPHLMIPVVTDPKKAASALNWAVQEMTNRYKLFADNSVRDIKGYNNLMLELNQEIMPQMVIIIDELADLMMSAPGEVEDAICRLAQMARAAGIHLVIATQRPSVDVITGVIKANIPSRLAFAVSSGTDSRTILDMAGAEKLLGKGDMLFYPVGANKPIRIQGAFISDSEVEALVNSIKSIKEAEYNQEVIENINDINNFSPSEELDEYLEKAIEIVVEKEKASISMLQRYLRIGFNRAARLMEEMEQRGIVGPEEGSKPRKVLINIEEFEQMKQKSQQTSNFS